jgi:hypothetical protein
MTALESYINERMTEIARRRIVWERRCKQFPAPVTNFISRKLWRWPYRHMRAFPMSSGLEPTESGGWAISRDSNIVATAAPLLEWIGLIDRPVTIVAGGPSAREHPISELRDSGRLVVAVNGVPSLLAEMGVRADAWIVSDPRLAFQIEENFPHAIGTPLAITPRVAASLATTAPDELSKRSLHLIERVNQWHGVPSLLDHELLALNESSGRPFLFPSTGIRKSVVGWSHRPELGFFSGCTVVFAALQLLIRLGAMDIEIIGMDLSGQEHAYPIGKGAIPNTLIADYEMNILPSFELMHEALRETDVVVRNLSPVCPLPRELFTAVS